MDHCGDENQKNYSGDLSTGEGLCGAVRAGSDHAVTGDLRALRHLTALEKTSHVSPDSAKLQEDIEPYIRRILAVWMFQVPKISALSAA